MQVYYCTTVPLDFMHKSRSQHYFICHDLLWLLPPLSYLLTLYVFIKSNTETFKYGQKKGETDRDTVFLQKYREQQSNNQLLSVF